MGMPSFVYRWFFLARVARGWTRGAVRFTGIHPVKETLIGSIAEANPHHREQWLKKMRVLGRNGQ